MKKEVYLLFVFLCLFLVSCSEVQTYKIYLDLNDGTEITSIEFNENEVVNIPEQPSRDGYDFVGWFFDDTFEREFSQKGLVDEMLNDEIRLYAKWDKTIFNIEYNLVFADFKGILLNNDEKIIKNLVGDSSLGFLTSAGRLLIVDKYNSNFSEYSMVENAFNYTDITSDFHLSDDEKIIDSSFGKEHSLVLTNQGSVFSWGQNEKGELGDGTTTSKTIPVDITNLFNLNEEETILSLTAGGHHSAVLTSSNRLFLWGQNSWGQIGNGKTHEFINKPIDVTDSFQLTPNEKIIMVSLGGEHSAALTSFNRLFLWGHNGYGQVGDNNNLIMRPNPRDITSFIGLIENESIKGIFLGNFHSAIVTSNHRVFSWGSNGYGQTGNGKVEREGTVSPVEITKNFNLDENDYVEQLALGDSYSIAFSKFGYIYYWGDNEFGIFNLDAEDSKILYPQKVNLDEITKEDDDIINVSAGDYRSTILTLKGNVITWGRNLKSEIDIISSLNNSEIKSINIYKPEKIDDGVSINENVYSIDSDNINIEKLEKEGFVYTEWFDNIEFKGEPIKVINTGSIGDINLYAKWSVSSNNIEFEIIDGTISILSFSTDEEYVTIPDFIAGYPVKKIGFNSFINNQNIKEIIIPEGVINIDDSAFEGLTNLTKIQLPNSLISIGECSFKNTSLISVVIPNGVISIGKSAFEGVTNLISIELPSSLASIGESAFENTSLKKVVIPEGITVIENSTFKDINSLTSIVLPNNLISIGNSAFENTSLATITIPEGVTTIGESAFRKTLLSSIIIPNSVTSIGNSIFEGVKSLTSVELSNNLSKISNSAFKDTSLNNFIIPENIKYIGKNAFSGISSLKSIVIPINVLEIGSGAFSNAIGLESIVIPESITAIESSTFRGASSLTSIVIPNSVTSIGSYAFAETSSLTSINIPNSVTSIGSYAFSEAISLESIDIPSGILIIENGLLLGATSLQNVVIPSSVTSIGNFAFSNTSSLENIFIPNSVTNIGAYAFSNASKLKSIILPNELISIAEGVFYGTTSLENISIPNGVTSIGRSAFENTGLVTINIPEGVISIGIRAFSEAENLKNITLPEGITNISDETFNQAYSLESINIPTNVINIGHHAFSETALIDIVIPENVVSIGNYAFYGIKTLKTIIIPNGVTSIGNNAFWKISSLESIFIPLSVINIGFYAFKDANNLTIYVEAESSPIEWNDEWNPSNRPVVWGYKEE